MYLKTEQARARPKLGWGVGVLAFPNICPQPLFFKVGSGEPNAGLELTTLRS